MTPLIKTDRLDHVHLYTRDRPASIDWYARVLGMRLYGKWREDNPPDDHPVFLATASGEHVISLFVGDPPDGGDRTVAFHADGAAFLGFATALPRDDVLAHDGAPLAAEGCHDYGMALTFNFLVPSGNHIEFVTYHTDLARDGLAG